MSFDFINSLTESALIRTEKSLNNLTARDVADFVFLYFIALQILRNEFDSAPFAKSYAEKTLGSGSIDTFRNTGNDLFLLMHVLAGKNNESSIKNLDNQEASLMLLKNINFDYTQAKRWLSGVASGAKETSQDKQFLLKLESMLQIKTSDYKSARRLAVEWSDLQQQERQLVMTRILMAFRSRISKSEILSELDRVAKNNRLEIQNVANPEKDKPTSNILTGAKIGGAIASVILAKSIKNFVANAGRMKKFK